MTRWTARARFWLALYLAGVAYAAGEDYLAAHPPQGPIPIVGESRVCPTCPMTREERRQRTDDFCERHWCWSGYRP